MREGLSNVFVKVVKMINIVVNCDILLIIFEIVIVIGVVMICGVKLCFSDELI